VTRTPDFFVVGHPKSGTTALWEMLRQHPQIYMPDVKEPHYFSTDGVVGSYSRQRYLDLFSEAASDQRAGEASVWYLSSRVAPQAICEMCPDAQIIALFREPSSFLRSLHLQLLEIHVEDERDLRAALALEPERRRDPHYRTGYPSTLLYSEHLRFVEQLRRYHELFTRENVLPLLYEDFQRDNDKVLKSVLRFLRVADDVQMTRIVNNPTVRVRSVRLHQAVKAVTMGRGELGQIVNRGVKRVTTKAARDRLLEVVRREVIYGSPSPLDDALALEIKSRFMPEVIAFSDYLKRDLVREWGYEKLL
jgi:hypothetical protein